MGRWSQAKPSTPKRGRKKKRKASPATTAGQKQRISRGSHLTDGQWRSRWRGAHSNESEDTNQ